MNTQHQTTPAVLSDEYSSPTALTGVTAKETYRAPQIKIHGKLERLTLQDTSPGTGGGGGGGTGPITEE